MTAPAPGTKEIEEVQPNRDLLFYFCVSRAPPAAHPSAVHFRQTAFGGALSVERPRRGITAAHVWLPPPAANHDEASNGCPSALS